MCSTLKVSIILKKNCLEKLLNAPMFSYNRKKYKQLMQNVSQTRNLLWSHGFVTVHDCSASHQYLCKSDIHQSVHNIPLLVPVLHEIILSTIPTIFN